VPEPFLQTDLTAEGGARGACLPLHALVLALACLLIYIPSWWQRASSGMEKVDAVVTVLLCVLDAVFLFECFALSPLGQVCVSTLNPTPETRNSKP